MTPAPHEAIAVAPAAEQRADDAKITCRDVSVSYAGSQGAVTAVRDFTLDIADGEFVTIVGPSGCGKSTLLKAIIGINRYEGEILVDGRPADDVRGANIGMVFQEPRLLPWRTVLRNVTFALESQGAGKREAHAGALTELRRVGLGDAVDKYPGQLSGGMQQRVNLARALAVDPALLMLDEPLAALDAQTREYMQQELTQIWESRRKTALFVTHQVDEAVYLGDRVVVLTRGPGRVKAVFDVPFPRPRPLKIKRTQAFRDLEDAVWESIDPVREVAPAGGAAS